MKKIESEKAIILLLASVQFINVLDFMMVMPLGPDFAKSLGIASSKLGWIGGIYTAAGAFSGIAASFFLDRYDRKKVLFLGIIGLATGTVAGAFSRDLWTLLFARAMAGFFGGPATSISLSILTDTVPPARRGRALATFMAAFSVASILGVPGGLELARLGSWRTPFFVVGALTYLSGFLAYALLPRLTNHLTEVRPEGKMRVKFLRTEVLIAYLTTALSMFGGFLMIPNFSAYFQYNLNFPREKLGFLYLAGGLINFVALRVGGGSVDKIGGTLVGLAGSIVFIVIVASGYVVATPLLPLVVLFSGFMVGMSIRNVAIQSLCSQIPMPYERARFMSVQTAVQHIACALGAFSAAQILTNDTRGTLIGFQSVAMISISVAVLIPVFTWLLERRIKV